MNSTDPIKVFISKRESKFNALLADERDLCAQAARLGAPGSGYCLRPEEPKSKPVKLHGRNFRLTADISNRVSCRKPLCLHNCDRRGV